MMWTTGTLEGSWGAFLSCCTIAELFNEYLASGSKAGIDATSGIDIAKTDCGQTPNILAQDENDVAHRA
jgi:hypothetical protein